MQRLNEIGDDESTISDIEVNCYLCRKIAVYRELDQMEQALVAPPWCVIEIKLEVPSIFCPSQCQRMSE